MKINFTRIIGLLWFASLVLFALRELSSGSSFFPYTRTRTSVPRLLAEGKDTEKVVIRGDVGSSYHATLLTLNTSVPSCAYNNNEIGHVGLAYGTPLSAIHWKDVLDNLDQSQECLKTKCDVVVSYCCFSRFIRVLTWYVDALQRHNVRFSLGSSSLLGALRQGTIPPCHYDAEIEVYLQTEEEELKMKSIVNEAKATGFVRVHEYGNYLFSDGVGRVDTYLFRPKGTFKRGKRVSTQPNPNKTLVWKAWMDSAYDTR